MFFSFITLLQAHSRDYGDKTPRLPSQASKHVNTWWILCFVLTIISFLVSKLPVTHQDLGGEIMRRQIARRIDDHTSRYKELEQQETSIKKSTLTQIEEINAVIRGLTDNVRVLEGLLTRAESNQKRVGRASMKQFRGNSSRKRWTDT